MRPTRAVLEQGVAAELSADGVAEGGAQGDDE